MIVKNINIQKSESFFYYYANSNASIIQLEDNNYILSFKSFRRKSIVESISNHENNPSMNHPWVGGPESYTWWQPEVGGFIGTGYMILDSNFNVIQILDTKFDDWNDVRLIETNGKLLATYHTQTDLDEISIKGPGGRGHYIMVVNERMGADIPGDFSSCYSLIHATELLLSKENEIYSIEDVDTKIACQNVSSYNEKNWSFWTYDKQLYISYFLIPHHIVFESDKDNINNCSIFISQNETIFNKIEKYYDGAIRFSLGTPAIQLSDIEYMAVGHVVLMSDKVKAGTIGFIKNIEFNELSPLPGHNARYFMFMYTFHPNTLETKRVSHAFLPPKAETNVVFPTGLLINNNKEIVISYGESDSSIKILTFPLNSLDLYLHDNITVETFDFIKY